MQKPFKKELVMTKKDNEDFKNSGKCCICDNFHVNGYVKVRDHRHISGEYRASAHIDLIQTLNQIIKFLLYCKT